MRQKETITNTIIQNKKEKVIDNPVKNTDLGDLLDTLLNGDFIGVVEEVLSNK